MTFQQRDEPGPHHTGWRAYTRSGQCAFINGGPVPALCILLPSLPRQEGCVCLSVEGPPGLKITP